MTEVSDITIKDVYLLLQDVVKNNSEIKEEIKQNRDSLSNQLSELKQEFSNKFQELKLENNVLKEENTKLKEKIAKIERSTKKYNLVVYGLKEEPNSLEDIEKIINLFNSTLNIPCAFTDLRDIFRLGKHTEGKNRPVLIEVVSYHLKREVLSNAKKLKGSGIFIESDYSVEDYANRKLLIKNQKEARKLNLDSKIKNNTLIIEGKKYTAEDLKITPKCITDRLVEGNKVIEKTETKVAENVHENGAENTNLEEKTGTKRKQETTDGNKVKRSARINSSNKI